MPLVPLFAMVRKDLQLFFTDRRSVIVSFVVPIAIASFFGSVFSATSQDSEPAGIALMIVDRDASAISKAIVSGAQADRNLRVTVTEEDAARASVREGDTPVAVVIPAGFGEAAGAAFFTRGEKPIVDVVFDPSRRAEAAMVRGILTQHVMEAVSREMFGGAQGQAFVERTLPQLEASAMDPERKALLLQLFRSMQNYAETPDGAAAPAGQGISMPYAVREQAMTATVNAEYNSYAHSFAGMGVQFLLFAMANLGIEMLLERQRGLWKRLRSAPISRLLLLTGKTISGAVIALTTLFVCFGFAMVVFGVRIEGSVVGFIGVCVACSVMAATFGLLVAALGSTPAAARGITTLAVLMMVMLGGAWVPAFIFPAWLQQATLVVPVRWAIDGMDATTWRGIGMSGAVAPILALLGFAAAFGTIAALRFRWEEV